MRMVKTIQLVTFCSAAIVWQTPAHAAQSNDRFVFVGYGDVKYESADVAGTDSFSTRFVPIFLFNLNDKMHVEAELEVSINENGETQTELEYADIHYFVNNNTTIQRLQRGNFYYRLANLVPTGIPVG